MGIESEINEILAEKLSNEFDKIFIEGLRLKGFEFDNQNDLHNFIKENCKAYDYPHLKERVYFVKDIPFLFHNYEVIIEPITEKNNKFKITANYGTYTYL
jgi:hypothetical protein